MRNGDEERGRRAAGQVKELIPEAIPFIKDLHQAGLIEGWRNVTYVGPLRESGGISADRIELRPKESQGGNSA